jgi:hypothetical protein
MLTLADIKAKPKVTVTELEVSSDKADLLALQHLATIDVAQAKKTAKQINLEHMRAGWQAVNIATGKITYDVMPSETAFIFDCETFVQAGNGPVMATACDAASIYVWLHEAYFADVAYTETLVPLAKDRAQIMVAHNASFDFMRISNRFQPDNNIKALCTMALGKALYSADRSNAHFLRMKADWSAQGRLAGKLQQVACNLNLVDLYNFVVKPSVKLTKADKQTRNIFVDAVSFDELAYALPETLAYAIQDAVLTAELFQHLFPIFMSAFKSNVVLQGIIKTADSFAPISSGYADWYADNQKAYEAINQQILSLILPEVSQFHADCMNGFVLLEDYDLDFRLAKPDGYRKRKPCPGYPIAFRWFQDLLSGKLSFGTRSFEKLLQFAYAGETCYYDNADGWRTKSQALPRPDGKDKKLGNIICNGMSAEIETGDLQSNLLSQDKLLKLFDLLESASTWSGYKDRFSIILPTSKNE